LGFNTKVCEMRYEIARSRQGLQPIIQSFGPSVVIYVCLPVCCVRVFVSNVALAGQWLCEASSLARLPSNTFRVKYRTSGPVALRNQTVCKPQGQEWNPDTPHKYGPRNVFVRAWDETPAPHTSTNPHPDSTRPSAQHHTAAHQGGTLHGCSRLLEARSTLSQGWLSFRSQRLASKFVFRVCGTRHPHPTPAPIHTETPQDLESHTTQELTRVELCTDAEGNK